MPTIDIIIETLPELGKTFPCGLCDFAATRLREFRAHCYNEHNDLSAAFSCHKCNAVCFSKREHDIHMQIHAEKVVCDHCGKSFSQAKGLRRHVAETHNGTKLCPCNQCNHFAARPHELRIHMQRMHGDGVSRKRDENRIAKLLEETQITFEREVHISFCDTHFARVDFVFHREHGITIVEVDENAHRYGYQLTCEMNRVAKIIEMFIRYSAGKLHIIRYNPTITDKMKLPKHQREIVLLERIKHIPSLNVEISYLYYPAQDGLPDICQHEDFPTQLKELITFVC